MKTSADWLPPGRRFAAAKTPGKEDHALHDEDLMHFPVDPRGILSYLIEMAKDLQLG